MEKKKKILVLVISMIAVVVAGLVGTFAWYVWRSTDEDITRIVTGVGMATVYYDAGPSLIGQGMRPVSSKELGIIKNIKVRTSSAGNIRFNLYLDINEIDTELKHDSFKYELYKDGTVVSSGNFSETFLSGDSGLKTCDVNETSHVVLLQDAVIATTESNYTLYIWIDGTVDNPWEMSGKNFSFALHADGENAIMQEATYPDVTAPISGTLAYQIVNAYDSSEKTTVENGSARYYYDIEDGLMSDIDGNVRYYGANPNNYVYFNCSDYSDTSTCELWRIIGVFDNKVKIIRDESIGQYTWDNKTNGIGSSVDDRGSNDWSDARLMMMLNDGYENGSSTYDYEGSLYWNGKSGTCYAGESNGTSTCDFTSTGIKNDTTRNMIERTTWNLGGWNSLVYSNEMYAYERGGNTPYNRTTSWTGEVGLMYASDYGYAADLSQCNVVLNSFNQCKDYNWLYVDNTFQWTMSVYPTNTHSHYAINIFDIGGLGHYEKPVYTELDVRPIVYLDANVTTVFGDGSSGSPYSLNASKYATTNLLQHITTLYTSSNPVEVNDTGTVVNVTTSSYSRHYYHSYLDTESTWGIMNDGLDVSGNETGNINEGNIRYFGTNPNNYIYFNCSDYNNQTNSTCELWRIVGIIDGKVKIIKNSSIGNYAWDSNGTNDWINASLNTLLNEGDYYVGLQSKNSKTLELISKSIWYINNDHSSNIALNGKYQRERNDGTSNGNIGLLYPSDYGYGTDLKRCKVTLKNYNTSDCVTYNWMTNIITESNQQIGWLITPYSFTDEISGDYIAWTVASDGSVLDIYGNGGYPVYSENTVVPTLYLDSGLKIDASGNGTEGNPYRLVVE